jgi:hypothetical protein
VRMDELVVVTCHEPASEALWRARCDSEAKGGAY